MQLHGFPLIEQQGVSFVVGYEELDHGVLHVGVVLLELVEELECFVLAVGGANGLVDILFEELVSFGVDSESELGVLEGLEVVPLAGGLLLVEDDCEALEVLVDDLEEDLELGVVEVLEVLVGEVLLDAVDVALDVRPDLSRLENLLVAGLVPQDGLRVELQAELLPKRRG